MEKLQNNLLLTEFNVQEGVDTKIKFNIQSTCFVQKAPIISAFTKEKVETLCKYSVNWQFVIDFQSVTDRDSPPISIHIID